MLDQNSAYKIVIIENLSIKWDSVLPLRLFVWTSLLYCVEDFNFDILFFPLFTCLGINKLGSYATQVDRVSHLETTGKIFEESKQFLPDITKDAGITEIKVLQPHSVHSDQESVPHKDVCDSHVVVNDKEHNKTNIVSSQRDRLHLEVVNLVL